MRGMDHRVTSAVFFVLGALAVAGCTPAADAPSEPSATAVAAPDPTPSPTVRILTTDEAAELYLDIVCDSNATSQEIRNAFVAGESEYLAGGSPDVEEIAGLSAELATQYRQSAELFESEAIVWPLEVRGLIGHVRDVMVSDLGPLSSMTNASSYRDAYVVDFGDRTPEQESAAQEIRFSLGLPSDTVESCEGHEDKLQERHEEFEGDVAHSADGE